MKAVQIKTCFAVAFLMFMTVFVAGCTSASEPPAPPDYWPTDGWRTSTPEEQGMDSSKLADMAEYLQQGDIDLHSLVVVRHGYLVGEVYVYPYTAEQPHFVMSTTKSVMSMLTGVAVREGAIKGTDQRLFDLLPSDGVANLDERKKAITLGDLLTMTSGLEDQEDSAVSGMRAAPDWVKYMLDLPMSAEPGEKFAYSTGTTQLLSAALQKATGMSAREFANQELFAPLGIPAMAEERWPADPQGVTTGGFGLTLTPREMAKLGFLYLNQGQWDGKTIVSRDWVAASTKSQSDFGDKKEYGYLWWIDPEGRWYAALGRAGEHIFVYPAEELVVVFTAGLPTGNDADLTPLMALMDDYILPAVASDEPLPADADGQARLAAAAQTLAQPAPSASSELPPTAFQVSGKTYVMEENPVGWQTVVFNFQEGSSEVTLSVNGQAGAIGLDGTYRPLPGSSTVFPQALRGRWESPVSFVVDDQTIGLMAQATTRIQFAGDTLYVEVIDKYSGGVFRVQGTASPGN